MVEYVLMQKVQQVILEVQKHQENSSVWQLNVTSWAIYQRQDLK